MNDEGLGRGSKYVPSVKIEELLFKQSKNKFLTPYEKNRIKEYEQNKRKQNKAKSKKKK